MFIEKYENLNWPRQTQRVKILGLKPLDKERVFEVVKHEAVAKGNPWYSPKAIEHFDFSWCESQSYTNKELAFELLDTGELIGSGGLYIDEKNHKARLGYILHPAFWNKGYMTEIVAELLRIAFEDLDLHRVEADVYNGNIGSSRVLEKNGFQYEGRQRDALCVKQNYVSLDLYGLIKETWKQKQQIGE
ncbi:MAG: GNAT family N-acetyltransferase [Culicoidibacterales bacterium]